MNSKIRIDVDNDNQPVIKIHYEESDDIRDKLVKIFLDTFGGDSCWATFKYNTNAPGQNTEATIRPICNYDLPEEVKIMIVEAEKHSKIQNHLKNL